MLIITGTKVVRAPVAKRAASTGLPWTVEETVKKGRGIGVCKRVRDNQKGK